MQESPLTTGRCRDILILGARQPCVQAAVWLWPKHMFQGWFTIRYMIYWFIWLNHTFTFVKNICTKSTSCLVDILVHMLFTNGIYTQLVDIYSSAHAVYTCSTEFSSLCPCLLQPQRDCLWSLHVNLIDLVSYNYRWSRGSVCPRLWCGYCCYYSHTSGCYPGYLWWCLLEQIIPGE